jgi:hypothetical protein
MLMVNDIFTLIHGPVLFYSEQIMDAYVAQDREKWWALVNTVMELRVL